MSQPFIPIQEKVLASIAAGETTTAAAAEAGVHRNTVGNWMRSSPAFRKALARAHHGQKLCWREMAESRAAAAFAAIDEILANPDTPAGVRARVALAVIEMASATLEPPFDEWEPRPVFENASPAEPGQPAEKAQNVHNSAQAPTTQNPEPGTQTYRAAPKIGRNDPCPCGSGQKFKRCHLGKPLPEPPPAPAISTAA